MGEFGAKVKAYPNDKEGPLVGFLLKESTGDKDAVQVGSAVYSLTYREPADYDDAGPNGTYCNV